jgi:uncharacterized protein YprB with RNaseH-like and TPR domain
MSHALDWLRQQRRPPPTATPAPVAPVVATTTADDSPDVFEILRRLRERGPRKVTPAIGIGPIDRHLRGEEIAPGLWRHTEHRPSLFAPALLDLCSLARPARVGRRRPAPPDFDTPIARERLWFFDTETTGLAGGSGTRAFMVGVARFGPDGLTITQFTTATMAAETAMLRAALATLDDDAVLVSYNGRSYDRPLLSTRLTLARLRDPLRDRPHLDLLHPTRRRWRDYLPDCRLATVERQVLGIVRDDDLPGSEAPAAWLAFLRGGSAALLRRVGEHNAQDLASLAGLLLKQVEEPSAGQRTERAPQREQHRVGMPTPCEV